MWIKYVESRLWIWKYRNTHPKLYFILRTRWLDRARRRSVHVRNIYLCVHVCVRACVYVCMYVFYEWMLQQIASDIKKCQLLCKVSYQKQLKVNYLPSYRQEGQFFAITYTFHNSICHRVERCGLILVLEFIGDCHKFREVWRSFPLSELMLRKKCSSFSTIFI